MLPSHHTEGQRLALSPIKISLIPHGRIARMYFLQYINAAHYLLEKFDSVNPEPIRYGIDRCNAEKWNQTMKRLAYSF
jgi:hypothetical protein